MRQQLNAPEEVFFGTDFGRFEGWQPYPTWPAERLGEPIEGGQPGNSISFPAPTADMTYLAVYGYDRPGLRTWLPRIDTAGSD